MNLDQLVRKARMECDAFRSDGTASNQWTNEEVIDCVNTALEKAYRIMRLANSNLVTRVVKSTDSALSESQRFGTQAYSPSSLSIVADTDTYTLPPDFVRVVSIIPLADTDFSMLRFRPVDPQARDWEDASTFPEDDTSALENSDMVFYYSVIGQRTLHIQPTPPQSFDIKLTYQYRPNKLRNYSTGTITVTSAAITGSGTNWLSEQGAHLRLPCELIPGTSASATVPTPNVNSQYPVLSAITSATAATLTDNLTANLSSGTGYIMSMVPELPAEHHNWLALYAAALMRRKVNLQLAQASAQALEQALMAEVQPEITLRQQQISIPTDAFNPGGD